MRLSELTRQIDGASITPAGADPVISSVTHDSRRAGPGALFCAFPGQAADGRTFLPDAVSRGAAACLGRPPAPEDLPVPYVSTSRPRESAALCAAALAGNPAARLLMVGVTGTSGKTTTTLLIERILARTNRLVGLFGTLVYRGARRQIEAARTTPEATDLQNMLGELVSGGGTAAVLECSSHALMLDRLTGCEFDSAVYLNLSRDHLDFHGTMEAYFEAKARLFSMLKADGTGVVNADDPHGQEILARFPGRTWGFTFENESYARIFGAYRHERAGLRMGIADRATGRAVEFVSRLTGAPNAQNLLAAAATGLSLGIAPEEIGEALASVDKVPGRLEEILNDSGRRVFVDYAHKPGALEGVLRTVRDLAGHGPARVIAVFGCGGERDRGKRPLMGRIAALLADETILTSDNPRSEDPLAILAQIREGYESTGKAATTIADREEAIAEALRRSRPGDIVLIAGKGHETYQIIGEDHLPFDDREVTARLLAGLAAQELPAR